MTNPTRPVAAARNFVCNKNNLGFLCFGHMFAKSLIILQLLFFLFRNPAMAVPPGVSCKERARRGGALPPHLQGHHGAQAAHRGGHQGRPQQVRQACPVGDQIQVGAGVAALQPGQQQRLGKAVQPHSGEYVRVRILQYVRYTGFFFEYP